MPARTPLGANVTQVSDPHADRHVGPAAMIAPAANHVLAALSVDERRRLLPFLERVCLTRGTVLYHIGDEIRYTYFPVSGLVSLIGMTVDGETLQVAAVDRSGFVGVPVVLHERTTPFQALVYIPSEVFRVRAAALLDECRRNPTLHRVALQFTHRHLAHIAQSSVCHRFHTVIQRLCRWLLVYSGCLRTNTIDLTQELLSQMLGCPRSTVSMASALLQDSAYIRLRHGHIQILNRAGLESSACECARVGSRDALC
jgi:CRP-like cAMP-binding protein